MNDERKPSLIHLYYGDGKGKTTAAVGLLVRAVGHGQKALLVQFLKNEGTGELLALNQFANVAMMSGQAVGKFIPAMNADERAWTRQQSIRRLHEGFAKAQEEDFDLLVLDEVLGAIETGMLPEAELLTLLQRKPSRLEVVLTGRKPSAALLDIADYVTEMVCHRHPYEEKFPARPGIEY